MSPELESQKWREVFGYTCYRKKDKSTGSDKTNDRHLVIMGERDSDYEFYWPYGTHFIALYMSPW